ncbi:MAG: hypothetical protein J6M05_05455 [Cardiobacteriaceae bacterium]|nr:hypothetical protein [Cardiobacteriaceae bacterium]
MKIRLLIALFLSCSVLAEEAENNATTTIKVVSIDKLNEVLSMSPQERAALQMQMEAEKLRPLREELDLTGEIKLDKNWKKEDIGKMIMQLEMLSFRGEKIHRRERNNNTVRELEYILLDDKVVKISATQFNNEDKFDGYTQYYFIDEELFAAFVSKPPVSEQYYFKNGELSFYKPGEEGKRIEGEYKNCRICELEAKELLKKTKNIAVNTDVEPNKVLAYSYNIYKIKNTTNYKWENIAPLYEIQDVTEYKNPSLIMSFDAKNQPLTLFYNFEIPSKDGKNITYNFNIYFRDGKILLAESSVYSLNNEKRGENKKTVSYILNKDGTIAYYGDKNVNNEEMIAVNSAYSNDEFLSWQNQKRGKNGEPEYGLLQFSDVNFFVEKALKEAENLREKSTKKECHQHKINGEFCTYSIP